jgi:leader peptidase (prepilin peptidase)/N-methyltransferase
VVEALVGLLVAAVGWRYGLSWDAAIFGCLAVGLVTLGAIDLEHMRLPSPVVYVTAASCGLLILAAGTQQHRWAGLGWAAGCAAVALAVLGAIRWYYPSGMGAGDVRLAGLVGLVLGWSGPGDTLVGFLAGMLIAAAAGLVLIAAGRADRRTPIPFGTCLAAGAMLAVLAGPTIVSWYQTSIR